MDTPTKNRIAKLHPSVRNEVTTIIQECYKALTGRATVRVTQGLRTFAEQDALYQQGRTKPGKKVTNAKAGQSIHNYGFAVDIVLIIDRKTASWGVEIDSITNRLIEIKYLKEPINFTHFIKNYYGYIKVK